MKARRIAMAAAGLAGALCVWVFRGVWIRVTNDTSLDLQDVHLVGRSFDAAVDTIHPGRSRCVKVQPIGDSGLDLVYWVNEERFAQGDLGYLQSWTGTKVHLSLRAPAFVHSNRQATGFAFLRDCLLSRFPYGL